MVGNPNIQPKPKIPLPLPELYDKLNDGVTPLACEKGKGTDSPAVPLTALTENFSSILLIAPPPVGSEIEGISIAFEGLLAERAFGEIKELVSPEYPLEYKLSCFLALLFGGEVIPRYFTPIKVW
jgi:hypothetical protein